MYDSSSEVVARLDPQLRRRAAFVAHSLLGYGVAPALMQGGLRPSGMPSFWGWPLREQHTWHEEVATSPRSDDGGAVYRLEEDTYENHYLSADGTLLFESYCVKAIFSRRRADERFVKSLDRFGPATAGEIGYLDFTFAPREHNRHGTRQRMVKSWSVSRNRSANVKMWGRGTSNRINRLVAGLVDPATLDVLCPGYRARGRSS